MPDRQARLSPRLLPTRPNSAGRYLCCGENVCRSVPCRSHEVRPAEFSLPVAFVFTPFVQFLPSQITASLSESASQASTGNGGKGAPQSNRPATPLCPRRRIGKQPAHGAHRLLLAAGYGILFSTPAPLPSVTSIAPASQADPCTLCVHVAG